MDTAAVCVQTKKQVINLVSHHKNLLDRIEDKTCRRYLKALGFKFDDNVDIIFDKPMPSRLEGGRLIISVSDQKLSGYQAICYLICGTMKGGLNAVKLGALILDGVYSISIFYSIGEYKPNEKNKAYKVLQVLNKIFDGSSPTSTEVGASVPSLLSSSMSAMEASSTTGVEDSRSLEPFPFTALKRGRVFLEKTSKVWVVNAINAPLPQDLDISQLAVSAPNCVLAVEIIIGRQLLSMRDKFPNDRDFSNARVKLLPDWSPRRCRKAQAIARFFEKFKAARGAALTESEIFSIQKHALERLGGYAGPHEDKLYEIIVKKLHDGKQVTAKLVNQCIDALQGPPPPKVLPRIEGINDILTISDQHRNDKIVDVWDDFEFMITRLQIERLNAEEQNRILRVLKKMATNL